DADSDSDIDNDGIELSLQKDSGIDNDDKITNNGQVNVTGIAAGQDWVYKVDDGAWQAGSGTSFKVEGDADRHIVQVSLSKDGENPIDKAAKTLEFTLDTQTPEPTFTSIYNKNTSKLTIAIKGEAKSTVKALIDGKEQEVVLDDNGLASIDYQQQPNDQQIHVQLTATDIAGNESTTLSDNVNLLLDTVERLNKTQEQIDAKTYTGDSAAANFVSEHSYIEPSDLPYFLSCFSYDTALKNYQLSLENVHNHNGMGKGATIEYHLASPNDVINNQQLISTSNVANATNINAYQNWDSVDTSIIEFVLNDISQYANITFTPTDKVTYDGINYILANEFAGKYPWAAGLSNLGQDVYIRDIDTVISYTRTYHITENSFQISEDEQYASFTYSTPLHETLHSLGLAHNFNRDEENKIFDDKTFYMENSSPEQNEYYTVMSYNFMNIYLQTGYIDDSGVIAISPQIDGLSTTYQYLSFMRTFDAAYLHYVYGVAESLNSGDTTYSFHNAVAGTGTNQHQILGTDTAHHLADGTYIGNMVYIADGSGVDTFSAADQTVAVHINLTPGSWSYVQTAENIKTDAERRLVLNDDGTTVSGQMFIGYGTQIENAVGGNGNDTIIGNNAANYIDGGSGADIMQGKGGDDTYIVDNSQDQVIEEADGGNDTLYALCSYELSDYVEACVCMGDGDFNIIGNSLDNILLGNSGNNTLSGGAGNDYLQGKGGSNSLIGGAGQDIFAFDLSYSYDLNGNADTITDFNVKEDKLEVSLSDVVEINESNWQDYFDYDQISGDLAYSYNSNSTVFVNIGSDLNLNWINFSIIV
ncbi:MAG: hypothetical protein IK065_03535, partial [Neisseriaceae bacterium]|nr:hypothetical protein [Neisseriaceae bacterium]